MQNLEKRDDGGAAGWTIRRQTSARNLAIGLFRLHGDQRKIEALNNAIREVIPAMRKAAEGNPEVQFYVRVIRFSTGATWHIAEPTLLTDFKWVDLHAEGETDLGQAFALLQRR